MRASVGCYDLTHAIFGRCIFTEACGSLQDYGEHGSLSGRWFVELPAPSREGQSSEPGWCARSSSAEGQRLI